MNCPKCNGTRCYYCDGTGSVPRFIVELKSSDDLKHYLNTEPNNDYHLVSVCPDNLLPDYYKLIWELKD